MAVMDVFETTDHHKNDPIHIDSRINDLDAFIKLYSTT